jgi:signal transduction histidine kinase/CheY-like chemotaxis protein
MEQSKHIDDKYQQVIFKNTYLLSIGICLVGFLLNTLYIQNFPVAILALTEGIVLSLIYSYTNTANIRWAISFYILITLVSINICWFYTNGILGSSPFMFIVFSTVITSMIPLNKFPLCLALIITNLLLLMLIQNYYPPSAINYPNFPSQKIDIAFLTLVTILLSNIAIVYFKVLNQKRQTALKERNLKLLASKKALEIAKEKAEEVNKVKSHFLSVMSHEVRTPLNAILGISNLLNQHQYNSNEKTELVEALSDSTQHLLDLLNDVLDFNELETGQVELELVGINILDLLKEIEHVFAPKAALKKNRLIVNTTGNIPPSILIDEQKLRQVFKNLLSNAIKYTSQGLIEINVQHLQSNENKTSLLFEIKDTGIGIPVNLHNSIFQEFTPVPLTPKHSSDGIGLGLTITASLLQLMDSEIQVESNPNQGTRFYFTLECTTPHITKLNSSPSVKDKTSPSKILLVEDNKTNVLVLTLFLKKWNIAYEIAENGVEALSCFQNESFNLILMDMQMPVMDGFEATEEIRKINTSIPIIALTASATSHEKERAKIAGVNDYITKPFDPKHLLRVIQKHTLT